LGWCQWKQELIIRRDVTTKMLAQHNDGDLKMDTNPSLDFMYYPGRIMTTWNKWHVLEEGW
jgi:hypothetical protein